MCVEKRKDGIEVAKRKFPLAFIGLVFSALAYIVQGLANFFFFFLVGIPDSLIYHRPLASARGPMKANG